MRFNRVIGLLVLCASCIPVSGCVVVDDGTVGLSKRFGEIQDTTLPAGVYLTVPVIREVEVWNVKTQRRSKLLDIPSAEGLTIKVEATVLFRPENAVRVRKEIGSNFVQTVLDSTLVDTFREVIGKQRIEEVITTHDKLTAKVKEILSETLGVRGIKVEDLMVTGLELPQKFKEAVERKLEQEQKARQKGFELTQAKKDAEIEVARAEGAAKAQKIVRSTLSPAYLQYLWISTLNDNPNVIYVATEANMPLFRTTSDPGSDNESIQ